MGLFDFVKEFGAKLFGADEGTAEAAESIKAAILEDNPGIENLEVSMDDEGNVTLSGNASSVEAMEKAVLIAGNVQGVTNVIADAITVPEVPAEEVVEVEYYTIEKGDTLWAIATKYYGNGAKYTKIVEENLEVIKDADKIYPGQKIRIPKEA
jgi:nucleoid-associated protein YgaU